jgi:hypothetical protein
MNQQRQPQQQQPQGMPCIVNGITFPQHQPSQMRALAHDDLYYVGVLICGRCEAAIGLMYGGLAAANEDGTPVLKPDGTPLTVVEQRRAEAAASEAAPE